jgi:hypothetical protein
VCFGVLLAPCLRPHSLMLHPPPPQLLTPLNCNTRTADQQKPNSPYVPFATWGVPVHSVVLGAHLPLGDCSVLDPCGHPVHPPILPGLQPDLHAGVVGDGGAAVRTCKHGSRMLGRVRTANCPYACWWGPFTEAVDIALVHMLAMQLLLKACAGVM